jgi:putative transposase
MPRLCRNRNNLKMKKYKNKYRIPSARAWWWDYGWNGAYFITICTQNRLHLFGEIIDGKMILSNTGVIADILWHEIPNHCDFVELGDFVVMPNHIHGIIIIDKPNDDIMDDVVETLHETSLQLHETSLQLHETSLQLHATSLQHEMSEISPKPNSVSTIIRSYKSAVTKHANRLGLQHAWQTRFHDRIIRNVAEYQRISEYIRNNPARWKEDKFYNKPM